MLAEHFLELWNLFDFKLSEFVGLNRDHLKNGFLFTYRGNWNGYDFSCWSILGLINEGLAHPADIKATISGIEINERIYERIIHAPNNTEVGKCRCDHYPDSKPGTAQSAMATYIRYTPA
jgi:hypothetical protein